MKVLKITLFVLLIHSSSHGQTRSNSELSQLIDSLYNADQKTVEIKPPDSAAKAYQRTIRVKQDQRPSSRRRWCRARSRCQGEGPELWTVLKQH